MSVDEIRGLLAQVAVTADRTQTQINALAAEVRGLAANVGAAPGAAPPVLALQSAVQTVRKSSETTVQLSLPDDQHTVAELGDALPAPTDGITYIRLMDRNPWWFDFPRSISETRKVQSCYVARRK